MPISQQECGRAGLPDLSSRTEEEQSAYAMQMSRQGAMDTALEEDDCGAGPRVPSEWAGEPSRCGSQQ